MNNLSSYCGLVDAKISASYKYLPVLLIEILAKLAVEIKSSYTLLDQHRETQQTLLPKCIG